MHGGVGNEHRVDDVRGLGADFRAQGGNAVVQGIHQKRLHARGVLHGLPRVVDAGDDVLAVGDLRVHQPRGGDDVAAFHVHQVHRDLGRADIHGKADPAGRGSIEGDDLPFPHHDARLETELAQPGSENLLHGKIDGSRRQAVIAPEDVPQVPVVRQRAPQRGSGHPHLEPPHQGIRVDPHLEPFHLGALGGRQRFRRHVHPDVALRDRHAGETAALPDFLLRKGLPVLGRRLRNWPRHHLDPAAMAHPDAAANADQVHVEAPRTFQEGYPLGAETSPSHRHEFDFVHRHPPFAAGSGKKPPRDHWPGEAGSARNRFGAQACCFLSHSAPYRLHSSITTGVTHSLIHSRLPIQGRNAPPGA